MPQKITPNLWFDGNLEEAADFYCSVFDDGRIVSKTHYPNGSDKAGEVLTMEWEVKGMRFVGINGGPQFKFDEAVSFAVNCKDQDEVDFYWDKLREGGGEEGPCGWVKDRFGLSWQVTPEGMDEIFADPDPGRAERAFQAMMKMRKLDIAELRAAADGATVSGAS
jgi:predicted 3-demethylubiquinone-9 3-methyltransferase (glyoxalase superfamily)